jgi:predicted dehydrogenase
VDDLLIGIIGAGGMGTAHARNIVNLGAKVVAVHDASVGAAQTLAAEIECDVATDSLDALFRCDLDGVVIATPPSVRVEPIGMACERDVSIMIEKPPAFSMEEGAECAALMADRDLFAAVGFQLRYSPLYERLRDMLVGETVHLVRTVCTVDYYLTFKMAPWFLRHEDSGGPIAEQAIHVLDCARYVLGDPEPLRAATFATKNMAHDHPEYDAENAIQVAYELDDGVFGTHMNHCGTERFAFDLEVTGPHLRLRANATENRIVGYLHGQEVDEPAPKVNSIGLDKIGAWLQAIATGDRGLIRSPYEDALHTLALVEAARQAGVSGEMEHVEGYE